MKNQFKTFTPATNRTGIIESIAEIVDRHKRNELATAIVAPPRYGKSDIIRLSALELVQTGSACTALALAPWDNLADQLVSTDKQRDMVKRYMSKRLPGSPDVFRAGRIRAVSNKFHETTNLQHLFTATLQLINSQIIIFEAWLQRCMAYGQRPIVFIDEGQLLSVENEWGKIAELVHQYGAHVVLLTGTPYRADCKDIPGFKVETMSIEPIERVVSKRIDDQHIVKTKYEGTQEQRILIPHVETTLKDAWDIEALCRVEAKWIDVMFDNDQTLSEMTPAESRKNLRRAVTNRHTIDKAMSQAIVDMKERRKAGSHNSAIIVVTTSDITNEENGGEANWHARQVRNSIKAIDPDLVTIIATQADDNSIGNQGKGAANLRKFTGDENNPGVGDVLIVKNMGTVGLDCPRIKTVVLLGTTRQLATWVQTILRGATTWGDVKYFTLVLTDDIQNRENWEFIVEGQGGNITATELEKISEELIEKEKEEKDEEKTDVIDASHTRTQDSHNNGSLLDDDDVHRAIAKYPLLRERMSFVEIRGLILAGAINIDSIDIGVEVGVMDTGKEAESIRSEINSAADRIANSIAKYGIDNNGWIKARKNIMSDAKKIAGVRCELGKETDTAKLSRVLEYLTHEMDKVA